MMTGRPRFVAVSTAFDSGISPRTSSPSSSWMSARVSMSLLSARTGSAFRPGADIRRRREPAILLCSEFQYRETGMEEGAVLAARCKARSLNDPPPPYRKHNIIKRRHDNYGKTEITLAARVYRASCRKNLTLPLGFFARAPPYLTRAPSSALPWSSVASLGLGWRTHGLAKQFYRTSIYGTLPCRNNREGLYRPCHTVVIRIVLYRAVPCR